jgi:4-oxalocrotonate tautomerase
LGCKQTSVSVAIKEVKEEDWKEEVWDKCIVGEKEYLVKEPGYRCE